MVNTAIWWFHMNYPAEIFPKDFGLEDCFDIFDIIISIPILFKYPRVHFCKIYLFS